MSLQTAYRRGPQTALGHVDNAQQALLIGALGYGLAYWLGTFAFPKFPRLVVIETPDLLSLAAIVLGISVLSSLLGIWKAMRVEPNKVLS